jgi:hypothetical protein
VPGARSLPALILALVGGCLSTPGGPGGTEDAAGQLDGAPPSDGAVLVVDDAAVAGCQVLVDEAFDGTALDDEIWQIATFGNASIKVEQGALRMELEALLAAIARVNTRQPRSLPGLRFTVPLRGQASGRAAAGIVWFRGDNDLYAFYLASNRLRARHVAPGQDTDDACDACPSYQANSEVVLRLREQAGRVLYELYDEAAGWKLVRDAPAGAASYYSGFAAEVSSGGAVSLVSPAALLELCGG